MTTQRSTAPADLLTRLGAVADRGTLRITTRGRKTGKPHTVTIWFVVDGGTIFLGTLGADRDWVRNVQKSPDVTLEVEGLRLRGNATAIADVALEGRVRDLLAQKYWMAWIGSWFGMGPARTFRVDRVEVS